MQKEILYILEELKNNHLNIEDVEAKLSIKAKQTIMDWYIKYRDDSKAEIAFSKIIELMHILYIREDIDLYCYHQYNNIKENLSKSYYIKPEFFLQMLVQFKQIVYGT